MKTLTAFTILALLVFAPSARAQTDFDDEELDGTELEDPAEPMDDTPPTVEAEATPGTGAARPPADSLGVGLGFSPAATPAVFVDYQLNESIVLHGGPTFQFTSFSGDGFGGEADGSFIEFGVAAYGVYKWKELGKIGIGFIGGLEFAYNRFNVDMVDDSSGFDFRLAGGLKVDYYLLSNLSIYANTGLVLGLLGDASTARAFGGQVPPLGSDLSALRIEIGGNVRTMFGMTWWM